MSVQIDQIDLDRKEEYYTGSVQNIYTVAENEDLLISETTVGGSVFDVGTIFSIAGSDTARAAFRHLIYRNLMDPRSWVEVEKYLADIGGQASLNASTSLKSTLEDLKQNGLRTHHVGMIEATTGRIFSTGNPPELSNLTLISKFQVKKPEPKKVMQWHFYDYEQYHHLDGYVIPLEYIVRFGVTSGSSILRKYNALSEKGRQMYMQELGLDGDLVQWTQFGSPIIDFTTKYEPEDRNINRQEAVMMAGIEGDLFAQTMTRAILASYMVSWVFNKMGLYLWDLKWEIATRDGELIFVDTIDTDSVRATLAVERDGHHYYVHFNKQAMRDYYKIAASDWYADVNAAKKEAARTGAAFTSILKAGQDAGKYAPTPEIDERFMALQERKFSMIKRFISEEGRGGQYREEALEIANAEVDYFLSTDKPDLYKEMNAID